MSNPSKLSEDWPAEDDKDLLRFAEQLQAAVPTMSPAAMARVEQRVQDELQQQERRPIRFRRVWAYSAAAVILLALGLGAYMLLQSFMPGNSTVANVAQKNEQPVPAVFVDDRITVAVGAGVAHAVEKPLLQLEKHRSLFTN